MGQLHATLVHTCENIVPSPRFACGIMLTPVTQFFESLAGISLAHNVYTFSGNLSKVTVVGVSAGITNSL